MSLMDKVAVVTGGTGGLGSVHCLTLAKAGCHIAVLYTSQVEKGNALVQEIQALGRKAIALKLDISDLEQVQDAIKKAEEALGPVSILVNNAASGIIRACTLVNMKKSDWDRDLSVNLTGAFNTIKCCLPGMMERGWGRIINISSIAGTMGGMGQCSYATTKAGLLGLTKTVALEGARKCVTCNALVLGSVDGGAFNAVPAEFRERITKQTALRRLCNPQEASNALLFLASEESSYITGTEIEVSGGAGLFIF